MKDCIIGVLTGILACGMDFWDFNNPLQYVFVFLLAFAVALICIDRLDAIKEGLAVTTRKSLSFTHSAHNRNKVRNHG